MADDNLTGLVEDDCIPDNGKYQYPKKKRTLSPATNFHDPKGHSIMLLERSPHPVESGKRGKKKPSHPKWHKGRCPR